MTARELKSPAEVAAWLRGNRTWQNSLSWPYERKWETGGCSARHDLWTWPSDRFLDLATGLASCGYPISGVDGGVVVASPNGDLKVCVNRSNPGDGPPDAYALWENASAQPVYIGNSPEVIVEMVRGYGDSPPPLVDDELVIVGFPGRPVAELTYVGSWQWGVHGEARGEEFVRRAGAATLDAINARRNQR
jgi:hypothetical protein